jgi:hypothetical protein
MSVRKSEWDLLTHVVLPFDFCGCETWSVAMGKGEYRWKIFESTVLRKVFRLKRNSVRWK